VVAVRGLFTAADAPPAEKDEDEAKKDEDKDEAKKDEEEEEGAAKKEAASAESHSPVAPEVLAQLATMNEGLATLKEALKALVEGQAPQAAAFRASQAPETVQPQLADLLKAATAPQGGEANATLDEMSRAVVAIIGGPSDGS